MIKAVMYHYVRRYSSELPYLKFLDEKDFIKQLDFLKKSMGLLKNKTG